ncbi:dimethylamine monooxygenase subunit DmmA family protein [Conexibacter sp. DBS9H8]|uniref:dimethylamine monooxygenase subunit DmmA family protein n=1 Tax=Conexibacter sp. DBS9H8 TaxID=2937801 RepID=UPI00200CB5D6|nr:dimethylamine monooxygenase subunit DmmA family protein [Conexibacter sp. DBS9H8]
MVGVSPEHTSVPAWPTDPGEIDPAGQSFQVLGSGRDGVRVARAWLAQIARTGRPVLSHVDGHTAPERSVAVAALGASLARARVGVRVMIAGPELVALDAIAAARAAGAIDAELRVWVSDRALKRVYCPHCRTFTVARVQVADTFACGGCARTLVVYHHLSRRHGAYLGFLADVQADAGDRGASG